MQKIKRYQEKRSRRKYSRKIEYSIRRQVAERRNRVQGRFAGNNLTEGDLASIEKSKKSKPKNKGKETGTLPVINHPVFRYERKEEQKLL